MFNQILTEMSGALHSADVGVFQAVNSWCGNVLLDRVVQLEENSRFFRTGILLTVLWWFWFAHQDERRKLDRRRIVAALIGVVFALVAARALALVMPLRARPMYVSGIGYHPPSTPPVPNMMDWSSFPSDTATVVIALSFGVVYLSRRLGVVLLAFSALWVCLPRLYLGLHYPSDLIIGGLLGAIVVWACVTATDAGNGALGRRIMAPLEEAEERRPQLFYAAAFALSFEIASMFGDIQNLVREMTFHLHHAGHPDLGATAVMFVLGGMLLALVAIVSAAALTWRMSHRGRIVSRPIGGGPTETSP